MRAGSWHRFVPLLVFLLMLLCACAAAGQNITLHKAVELAISRESKHERLVPLHRAGRRPCVLRRRRVARAAYLPRVIFGSGIGGSYGFPLSLENAAPSLFNVTSQQVLYSPAQKAFVKAARTDWQAAQLQGKDQRDALIQDTVLTYVELNKWNQEIELLNTELANNLKVEGVEAERVKAGVDRPVEQNRAKLATARVRMRMAEAKGRPPEDATR